MRQSTTLVLFLAFVSVFGQESVTRNRVVYDQPRNSLILTTDYVWSITAGYLNITPLSQNSAFIGRIGVGPTWESGLDLTINGDLGILFGQRRDFVELGIGFYGPQTVMAGFAMFPNICYHYIGKRGFTYKAGVRMSIYTKEEDIENAWEGQFGPWPLLQVGYIIRFKHKK